MIRIWVWNIFGYDLNLSMIRMKWIWDWNGLNLGMIEMLINWNEMGLGWEWFEFSFDWNVIDCNKMNLKLE